MRVDEVMTHSVVTAQASDTLHAVGELMRDHGVGSVVILDGERPVGVLTDRDLAIGVVADHIDPAENARAHMSRARRRPEPRPADDRGGGPGGAPWLLLPSAGRLRSRS